MKALTVRPGVRDSGAGPVGLMGALMAVQRGFEVHVIDLVEHGPKPELVAALGATYHAGASPADVPRPDIVVESTGVPGVILGSIAATAPNGITCLTGLSPTGRRQSVDLAALNMGLVLENDVVFGSVNANREHYDRAAAALAEADAGWLEHVITRRVPLERWADALQRRPDDVKVVVELGA